jgi:hypothetical protein
MRINEKKKQDLIVDAVANVVVLDLSSFIFCDGGVGDVRDHQYC